MTEAANVVRIEEFLAERTRQGTGGVDEGLVARRELTPREVSHRFRMLAHLKRVADASAIIRMTS